MIVVCESLQIVFKECFNVRQFMFSQVEEKVLQELI